MPLLISSSLDGRTLRSILFLILGAIDALYSSHSLLASSSDLLPWATSAYCSGIMPLISSSLADDLWPNFQSKGFSMDLKGKSLPLVDGLMSLVIGLLGGFGSEVVR